MSTEIITDGEGRPLERPRASSFADPVEFVRAVHAYNDRISSMSCEAFNEAWRAELKAMAKRGSR